MKTDRFVITIHIDKIEIHIMPTGAPDSSPAPASGFVAICPECGWTKPYATEAKQRRGLAAHQAHCPGPMDLDVGGKLSELVEEYFDRNGTTTIYSNRK